MDRTAPRSGSAGTIVDRVDVIIVEDHKMVAESLAARIDVEPDLRVVGVANDAASAKALLEKRAADLVVVDYRLPDADGASLGQELRRGRSRLAVLLYTGFETADIVQQARKARLAGVVFKSSAASELIDAVRTVGRGGEWFPIVDGTGDGTGGSVAALSRRELEVLQLVARGATVEDIASELGLSHHTVRNHIRNITGKLGVHSKLEAVARGLQSGFVTLD
jgi:two-component system nitrate/nitrite response regulator NarL